MDKFYIIVYIDHRFGVLQLLELFRTIEAAYEAAIKDKEYRVISIPVHNAAPEHFTVGCG